MDFMLALISFLGTCVGLCSACSCVPYGGPQRFCEYDVIFRGTVLSEYEERQAPVDFGNPFDRYYQLSDYVYTVRVEQAVKMPESLMGKEKLILRTHTVGSLCGTRFPVDADAVFFARVNGKEEIRTGLCEPNAPWNSLSDSNKELMTDHLVDFCNNQTEPGHSFFEP